MRLLYVPSAVRYSLLPSFAERFPGFWFLESSVCILQNLVPNAKSFGLFEDMKIDIPDSADEHLTLTRCEESSTRIEEREMVCRLVIVESGLRLRSMRNFWVK